MTEETNQDLNNFNISLEQLLAAIINDAGTITIGLEDLLKDFSGKTIAVTQNEETRAITFEIADAPAVEISVETETE
jgi:hypothetical protein